MGVSTSFFSASQEQLEAAAPGWVRPKYGAFGQRETLNPFTGEETLVKQHELLSEEPEDCPPDAILELIEPERAYGWKLDGGELEALMKLITDASDDKLAELTRRALLGPADAECWVFEIPDVLVKSLARLHANEVPSLAAKWQEELVSAEPPIELLEQLVAVASEAVAAQHRMFSYVSL